MKYNTNLIKYMSLSISFEVGETSGCFNIDEISNSIQMLLLTLSFPLILQAKIVQIKWMKGVCSLKDLIFHHFQK